MPGHLMIAPTSPAFRCALGRRSIVAPGLVCADPSGDARGRLIRRALTAARVLRPPSRHRSTAWKLAAPDPLGLTIPIATARP
jgi:hypothetical protein